MSTFCLLPSECALFNPSDILALISGECGTPFRLEFPFKESEIRSFAVAGINVPRLMVFPLIRRDCLARVSFECFTPRGEPAVGLAL